MTPELKAQADKMIAGYQGATKRYRTGRREAALIQAKDKRLTAAQVAYWEYIAAALA